VIPTADSGYNFVIVARLGHAPIRAYPVPILGTQDTGSVTLVAVTLSPSSTSLPLQPGFGGPLT